MNYDSFNSYMQYRYHISITISFVHKQTWPSSYDDVQTIWVSSIAFAFFLKSQNGHTNS